MTTIHLVRHGQSSFGKEDYDNLSEIWLKQAFLLGQYFKTLNIKFDKIFVGTFKRQVQTYKQIIKSYDISIDYESTPLLNEYDVTKIFYSNINVDLKKIIFINDSRNTIENIKAFKNVNTLNQSNILITSAFHMKRSMMIAKELDLNIKPYAVDFRSLNNFNILNYYQKLSIANNWQSFNIFFREIIGILAFKLFY